MIRTGTLDHRDRRLATIAFDLQLGALAREARIGMMWAIVDRVQIGAPLGQQRLQLVVDLFQARLATIAACDRRLVRHDDREKAGTIQSPDGLAGARNQFELIRRTQTLHVDVERTVSIEEYGGAGFRDRNRMGLQASMAFGLSHPLKVLAAVVSVQPKADLISDLHDFPAQLAETLAIGPTGSVFGQQRRHVARGGDVEGWIRDGTRLWK